MVELNAELAVTDLSVPAEVDMLGAIPVGYEPTSGRGGLSDEIKQAILDCFQHVAWVDPDGAEYYQALYDLFFPPAELVRISAVYTQSGTVYPTTSLASLKSDLVVTAHYSDGTSATVASADYTLSGTLTVGTSSVVATYSGKSTSFNVTVTAAPVLSSISAVYTQSGTVYTTDSLDSLKTDLVVTAHYSDSSSETVPAADYTLSGTLTEGTSSIDVFYGGKGTTFTVTVTIALPTGYTRYDYIYNKTAQIATVMDTGIAGSYCSSDYGHELIFAYVDSISTTSYGMYGARDQSGTGTSRAYWLKSENGVPKIDCTYNGAAAGFTEISAGTKYDMITANGKWTVNGTDWDDSMSGTFTAPEPNIRLFGVVTGTTNSYSRAKIKIYGFKVWEIATGTVIANLVPCVKTSNSKPGFYDTARSQFITITNYTNLEAGNDA